MDDGQGGGRSFEPFDIDRGELVGLRDVDCFVSGYELALVHAQLDAGGGFSRWIHTTNTERVLRACVRRGRHFRRTRVLDSRLAEMGREEWRGDEHPDDADGWKATPAAAEPVDPRASTWTWLEVAGTDGEWAAVADGGCDCE